MTEVERNLRTVKKTCEITGASQSFIYQLLQEGQLTMYKINTATYVSLSEFDAIAKPVSKAKITEELKKKIEV